MTSIDCNLGVAPLARRPPCGAVTGISALMIAAGTGALR